MSDWSDSQFAGFFRTHFSALVLYASGWTDDPQNVVQEAFLKLAEQRPAPISPVAWLHRVVRNLALNQRRSDSRRKKRQADWARQRQSYSSPTHVPAEGVRNALDQLPSDGREIVIARIWGGLTFQQIAELTGKPLPTCHRHYQQSLLLMKQTLHCEIPAPACEEKQP